MNENSLACMVRDTHAIAEANATCLDEIKLLLAALEGLNLEVLCEKIDAVSELICSSDGCPDFLAEEATATELVVEGDQTANYVAGQEMDVFDSNGTVVGTADVVSSSYDAAANQTTIQYNNLQPAVANQTVQLQSIKAVKRLPVVEGEGGERELAERETRA